MRRQWWGLLLGIVAVGAVSGCSSLGIESQGRKEARRLSAEKQQLASENISLQTDKEALEAKAAAERERALKLEGDIKALNERLAHMNTGGGTVAKDGPVRLQGDVLFMPGKVSVRPQAKPLLEKVASIVKNSPNGAVVYVDGHTDSDPLVRTKNLYKDNYGLSKARAQAVASALASMGVAREKLVTRGFGADHPIADNKTTAGKAQNRRVEISVGQKVAAAGSTASAKATTPVVAPK